MTKQFDVVVIGTGTAASTVATACREAGWQVAIIDSLPFGGTCALRGCDPKKVLVGAAEVVDWARRVKAWPGTVCRTDERTSKSRRARGAPCCDRDRSEAAQTEY